MKKVYMFVGQAVVAFVAAVAIDRTLEATHKWWVSRKKFPGKRKKKRVRNNGRPGKVA